MRELAAGVRKLLAPQPGEETSQDVAERAARVCERLTQHLARLVGEAGVNALIRRSMVLASSQFPWLSIPLADRAEIDACPALHAVLERQAPTVALEGFVGVFATLIGLLKRLIGDGLVDHLLAEVWPAIFPLAVEETA